MNTRKLPFSQVIIITALVLSACLGRPRILSPTSTPSKGAPEIQELQDSEYYQTETPTPEPSKTIENRSITLNPPTPSPFATPEALEIPAHFAGLLDLIQTDLARRLNTGKAEVVLVEFYADEFPASNLGCPVEKGVPRPLPAILTGNVFILEAQGYRYIYHTHGDQFVFCGQDQ